MTIVTEAKDALRNGTQSVLSTVQRRQRTSRRLPRVRAERLMKQVTRRFEPKRTRQTPIVPIAIAAGAAVIGVVVGTIALRRYLTTGFMGEEAIPLTDEMTSANEHVEAPERTLIEPSAYAVHR